VSFQYDPLHGFVLYVNGKPVGLPKAVATAPVQPPVAPKAPDKRTSQELLVGTIPAALVGNHGFDFSRM
jgi:hypothetical protein